MDENTSLDTITTESDSTSTDDSTQEGTASEDTSSASTEAAPPVAPAPAARPAPVQRINRRVYVDHKRHGTCITVGANVYLVPLGTVFAAKSAPKCDFLVSDGRVFDLDGGEWVLAGENPGCGPRCPVSLREQYGKVWINLTHAERREILKALAAPAAK